MNTSATRLFTLGLLATLGRLSTFGLLFIGLQIISSGGGARADEGDKPNVFDRPRLQAIQTATQRQVLSLFSQGKYAEAEKLLQATITQTPGNPTAHYNLACALAQQGKTKVALASLAQAVTLGFRDSGHIKADNDLKNLRDEKRFAEILDLADKPIQVNARQLTPAKASDGQVIIGEANVAWNPRTGIFHVAVELADAAEEPIAKGLGEAGELLRKWHEEGTAAGNQGDLYDNHDTDHSNMNYGAFPQLTRVEFSEAAKKRRLHHGLQRFFLYNKVTIGNSSTALTSGPFWRCQGRYALTQPQVAALLYIQYRTNQLYFYPEHRDHDPGHNGTDKKGHGDVLPANTPYLILSQGSSGSDRAFLNAVAATLAAFRPEVKKQLAASGMLMPTVQMIFRASNKTVATPEDYLTGKAHPSVFDGKQLDVEKMISLAHQLEPDSLPPLVQIKVLEEDEAIVGRDYFDVGPRERLFDTPSAIARIVKSTKYTRRMVVSAADSLDLRKKPLKFHWVVLRGDEERIRIVKRNESGSEVELLVSHHERRPVTPGSEMESNRVDIGVFVHNGDYYSAPAFISYYYLDNEKREYDDQHRIRVVDYAGTAAKNYVDPLLDFRKDWRDEYSYDDSGDLFGWTRIRGDDRQSFTADGKLIIEKDDSGQPTKTAEVRYAPQADGKKTPLLVQQIIEKKPQE